MNDVKEIITVGDLIEFLRVNFGQNEPIVKSDRAGYNRFKPVIAKCHITLNPDRVRHDVMFIDAVVGKTYSVDEVVTAVVL